MPDPAGPLRHATLRVGDIAAVAARYARLGLVAGERGAVGAAQATAWGQPALAGCGTLMLAVPGAAPLLRLIECPGAAPRPTRFSHGWLALEVLVRDVDALAPQVEAAGFEIVGAPADLDVSPAIRAMQAVGPAGEMLYLTQVKAPVPPFRIPLSSALRTAIGPLFIGVMSVPSREAALAACEPLAPAQVLRFDTKVTVLNRALGRDLGHRWPVATAQFGSDCLFEIDEVADARLAAPTPGALPDGLAWVTMAAPGLAPGLRELAPGVWLETE